MKKEILVLTDFSKCSESALKCGVTWASKANANIQIFHKFSALDEGAAPLVCTSLSDLDDRFDPIRESLREIDNIIDEAGLSKQYVFSAVGVSKFVSEYVANNPIEVIFMGSRGVHKTKEDELGSNALSVLMHAKVSVVVTKEEVQSFNLRNVVFASDYNAEAKPVFRRLLDFVSYFDPEVHLLTIDVPKFFNATKFIMIEAMQDFANMAEGVNTSTHFYKNSKVGHGIVDFCNDMDADLIAFSESGRTVFGRARFARPVGYLVQYARQPVLFVGDSENSKS